MHVNQSFNFQEYFDNNCCELDVDDLYELNKQDSGALNNVINYLADNCYGILIFEDKEFIDYVIYFASNKKKLKGISLEISMRLRSEIRIQLLFEFCKLINYRFNYIDLIDSFNNYQSRLRTGFEKIGFLTVGNEVHAFGGKMLLDLSMGKKVY